MSRELMCKHGLWPHENCKDCRIEELEQEVERLTAENRRLFDAHSVEMVRADALKQELEWLQQETDDE